MKKGQEQPQKKGEQFNREVAPAVTAPQTSAHESPDTARPVHPLHRPAQGLVTGESSSTVPRPGDLQTMMRWEPRVQDASDNTADYYQ
jgi:hypothetical protein